MVFRLTPVLLCLFALGHVPLAHSATFKVGLLHGDAEIFGYELSVIRLALANAPGEHELEVVPMVDTPQNRIFAIMDSESAPINVFFSGYSQKRERQLRQVNIPMTRGLLGFRLLVAKSERLNEFSNIRNLEDLQQLRIGSGIGWPENEIMVLNGLTLDTSAYRNLWKMLRYERFDVFHRGLQEVFTELKKPEHEHLSILPDIALAMRYDYFLYVSRDRPDLHDILMEGLENAHRNGEFIKNFRSHPHIRTALDQGQLAKRKLIWLNTPESSLSQIPAKYWYEPFSRVASSP